MYGLRGSEFNSGRSYDSGIEFGGSVSSVVRVLTWESELGVHEKVLGLGGFVVRLPGVAWVRIGCNFIKFRKTTLNPVSPNPTAKPKAPRKSRTGHFPKTLNPKHETRTSANPKPCVH